MTKIVDGISLFFFVAVIAAIGNTIGYKVDFIVSLKGSMVLAFVSAVGYVVAMLPLFRKLPVIFWVSIVAVLMSIPAFPLAQQFLELTKPVNLLAVCTPILTYGGLSIGKDIEMFKKMSWRVVPVALAVFTGTFIFAALLAEVTLRWEGVI